MKCMKSISFPAVWDFTLFVLSSVQARSESFSTKEEGTFKFEQGFLKAHRSNQIIVYPATLRLLSNWSINYSSFDINMSKDVVKTGGFTYEDGTCYVGGWNKKGQKHGFGHLSLPDSTRYVGGFENGLCCGLGVIIFPDGARYEGEFLQGWFHGHGIFWRADGMKYEGEFRGGRLWGWGLITFRDSTHGFPKNEGFFQDCKLIRNKKCDEVVEKARKVALLARIQAKEC